MTAPGVPLDPVRDRDSRTTALTAARAALEKQAEDVVILDLRAVSTITDFFLVCTADNPRQIEALKDHVEAELRRRGCRVEHTEPGLQWVLMDCGDLVVHLFDRQARDFYRLEDLWADAPRVPVESFP